MSGQKVLRREYRYVRSAGPVQSLQEGAKSHYAAQQVLCRGHRSNSEMLLRTNFCAEGTLYSSESFCADEYHVRSAAEISAQSSTMSGQKFLRREYRVRSAGPAQNQQRAQRATTQLSRFCVGGIVATQKLLRTNFCAEGTLSAQKFLRREYHVRSAAEVSAQSIPCQVRSFCAESTVSGQQALRRVSRGRREPLRSSAGSAQRAS